MPFVILNKNNPKKELKFNLEAPYVKITNIEIISLQPEREDDFARTIYANSIQAKAYLTETKTETEYIDFNNFNQLKKEFSEKKINIDRIVLDSLNANKLEIIINNLTQFEFELKVNYETFNQNINITNPSNNFKAHIDLNDNVKILFSAPFGQGKSTFLKYFFEQHQKEFEVFKVFPVNYSISHNEDVFKYIKTEILFQLLGRDIEFDKSDFTYFDTLPAFFTKDPIRILAPLLKLIPKVGKTAHEVFQDLYKIANEYLDYHHQSQVDDEKLAKDFIEEMYKNEGSIFEDNFFTQLIRQQLEKLKIKNNKKNVLIIEDLDRMDPEHIFRILNVFAAHFDTPEYLEGYTNKFGFDKIIIVADYENIKNIFSYRYGPNVNFSGYINKYYSREPFYFDNKNAVIEYIDAMNFSKNEIHQTGYLILKTILCDMNSLNLLSLREILKLQKNDIENEMLNNQTNNKLEKYYFSAFDYFKIIHLLNRIFDIDTLINKIEICIDYDNFKTTKNYHSFISTGLPSLVKKLHDEKGNSVISINDRNIQFDFELKNSIQNPKFNVFVAKNILILNIQGQPLKNFKFTVQDFYKLLLLNAKRFKEVGGFD